MMSVVDQLGIYDTPGQPSQPHDETALAAKLTEMQKELASLERAIEWSDFESAGKGTGILVSKASAYTADYDGNDENANLVISEARIHTEWIYGGMNPADLVFSHMQDAKSRLYELLKKRGQTLIDQKEVLKRRAAVT